MLLRRVVSLSRASAFWGMICCVSVSASEEKSSTKGGGALIQTVELKGQTADPQEQEEANPEATSSGAMNPDIGTLVSVRPDSTDLFEIVTYFEVLYGIPRGLLLAIATAESLRRPWAVNTAQGSYYFKTLDGAIDYVIQYEEKYNRSVSIGYMQVNWHVHKKEFANIAEAFSPYHNVRFAAALLSSLYKRHGSWKKAIGWYNPKYRQWNAAYYHKVLKQWIYPAKSLPERS